MESVDLQSVLTPAFIEKIRLIILTKRMMEECNFSPDFEEMMEDIDVLDMLETDRYADMLALPEESPEIPEPPVRSLRSGEILRREFRGPRAPRHWSD